MKNLRPASTVSLALLLSGAAFTQTVDPLDPLAELVSSGAPLRGAHALPGTAPASGGSVLDTLPFRFLENRGQWDSPGHFIGTKGGARVHVEPAALTVEVAPGADGETPPVTRFVFEGASEDARVEGTAAASGVYNFFSGSGDDARWAEGLTTYGQVLQRGVYEGIDVRLRSHAGRLEYDVLLAPGAELGDVVVRCEGVERLEVADDGRLLLHTAAGEVLEQSPPVTWAVEADGTQRPLECHYVLLEGARYGYALPERAADQPVVIDPGLEWSSFFGGGSYEEVYAVDQDAQGRVVIAGTTNTPGWTPPGMGAPFGTSGGNFDCYVAVLDPSQTGTAQVVWWTYFGGVANDWIWDIETNAAGEVFVVGDTASTNFPTTANAYDDSYAGSWDAFVVRLDPVAGTLLHSSFVGDFGRDEGQRLVVEEPAIVTMTGPTASANFPVTAGAFDGTLDNRDAYVAILDLDQSGASALQYATFVGGSALECSFDEAIIDVERRANGNVVLTTYSDSPDWPVTLNAYQNAPSGGPDVVIVEFDPSVAGSAALVYGTYLGSSDGEGPTELELDPSGAYVIAGFTYSGSFPSTAGAAFPFFNGPSGMNDGFITKIDPSLPNSLAYSTFLPGDGFEAILGLELVGDTLFATGFSGADNIQTTNLPVTCGAYSTTFAGARNDSFVLALTPAGNGKDDVHYLSYLGGNGWELGLDIFVESTSGTPVVLVGGVTEAFDFPITNGAFQTGHGGGADGFITRLRLNPYGTCVGNANALSPGGARLCGSGSVLLSDNAFDMDVSGLPQNSLGYFLMSTNPVAAFALPAPSNGALCLGGPQVRFRAFVLNSGTSGTVSFRPDLANIPPPGAPLAPGDTAHFQYWYRDTGSTSNTSNGLAVTFD